MPGHCFTLEPRDLLFLRDARPMAAADVGSGGNLPRPDQLWSALINAFHRRWPEAQPWEGHQHTKRSGENGNSSDRFGALKTCGPFPLKDNVFYLPMPLDWEMDLVPCTGTNLPVPLTHAFRDREVGKKVRPPWIGAGEYQSYLDGRPQCGTVPELFFVERNIGIGIDPKTRSTIEGKFYQAEYLRLQKGVSLWFAASCVLKNEHDAFAHFDEKNIVIGGQQGVAQMTQNSLTGPALSADIRTRYLRWTLLSPVVFLHGWLPDWCVDSRKNMPPSDMAPLGTVMLKDCQFAKLIAARVGKALPFSGWDLQTIGPKPTQLAVPAGSCYVFDCGTAANAQKLAALLDYPNRRSSVFGEKGFGIGICSSIDIDQDIDQK